MTQLPPTTPAPSAIVVVGQGRVGGALHTALQAAGHRVIGPVGRTYAPADVAGATVVLLCVPDREIVPAALTACDSLTDPTILIGHTSGATGLQPLLDATGGRREVFSLHPMMTVTSGEQGGRGLYGATAAVAGSSARAYATGESLAHDIGLRPVSIDDQDRAAYHAAASMASNFLVTLELAAERLAAGAGLEREQLVPLVRQTVENWAAQGPAALTGPIARGDEQTIARQRAAVAQRAPDLLELFDALTVATRSVTQAVPA